MYSGYTSTTSTATEYTPTSPTATENFNEGWTSDGCWKCEYADTSESEFSNEQPDEECEAEHGLNRQIDSGCLFEINAVVEEVCPGVKPGCV